MSVEVPIERKNMDVCVCGTIGFYNVLFPITHTTCRVHREALQHMLRL